MVHSLDLWTDFVPISATKHLVSGPVTPPTTQLWHVQTLLKLALHPRMSHVLRCHHATDVANSAVTVLDHIPQIRVALKEAWNNIPQDTMDNTVNSMRRPYVVPLEANGRRTRYRVLVSVTRPPLCPPQRPWTPHTTAVLVWIFIFHWIMVRFIYGVKTVVGGFPIFGLLQKLGQATVTNRRGRKTLKMNQTNNRSTSDDQLSINQSLLSTGRAHNVPAFEPGFGPRSRLTEPGYMAIAVLYLGVIG